MANSPYDLLIESESGLLAYYKGDDVTSTAVDASANGSNGTYNGGYTQSVAGLTTDGDTATSLNGSTGYIGCPTATDPTGLTAYSVEMWVKPSGAFGNARICANSHTDADNNGIQLFISATGVNWDVGQGTGRNGLGQSFTFSVGSTYHIVATYDGSGGGVTHVYVNGVQQAASGGNGGAISSSGQHVNFGRNPIYNGDFFPGTMAKMALYSVALSATQIAKHYAFGRMRFVPASAALQTTPTRTITANTALQTTATRTITATAALLTTKTRTVTSSAALQTTLTRTIPASAALITSPTRTIPASTALQTTLTRTITSGAALLTTLTRVVPASVALQSLGLARTVPASTALLSTLTRVVGSTTALQTTNTRTVPSVAAISAGGTSTRTVPASAALLTTNTRVIPASAALLTTLVRTVPSTIALQTTLQRTISASAALLTTRTRTIPASAALQSLGLVRSVPSTVALQSTRTRTVTASAALLVTQQRSVPTSAAMQTTNVRGVPCSVALSFMVAFPTVAIAGLVRDGIVATAARDGTVQGVARDGIISSTVR